MDEDNGFEIDDIIREGGWTAGGVGDEDPPIMQLPVAADDDNDDGDGTTAGMDVDDERAATKEGGWSTKKRMAIGLVASAAFLAVVVGLGVGMGTKDSQSSAASSAMTMEDCLATEEEEVFKSMPDVPTYTPTTSVSTTYVPTTDVPKTNVPTTDMPTTDVPMTDTPTTDTPTIDERMAVEELDDDAKDTTYDAFFPIFDDDRRGNEDGAVRRDLCGKSKDDVLGFVHRKMMQRLGTTDSNQRERVSLCGLVACH